MGKRGQGKAFRSRGLQGHLYSPLKGGGMGKTVLCASSQGAPMAQTACLLPKAGVENQPGEEVSVVVVGK